MDAHQTLHDWWSRTAAGIELRPVSDTEVEAIETRYGINIPGDFRRYLRAGTPLAENWDAEDGNWWRLEQIRNISEACNHPVTGKITANASKHLLFLDYHDRSWAWAISCGSDEFRGKIALIGNGRDGYVANSFDEFVVGYTTNWLSVSRVKRCWF